MASEPPVPRSRAKRTTKRANVPVSRTRVNAALQAFLAKRPRALTAIGTIDRFEAEIDRTDDRGMVLVASALLEQLLEDAILVSCIKKFEAKDWRNRLFGADSDGAAISGFHAKVLLGHALGIYGEGLRQDLDRIRRIRNVFAHAKAPLGFRSPIIRSACSFHLFHPNWFGTSSRDNTPKKRFLSAVAISMIILYGHTQHARKHRPRRITTHPRDYVYGDPPQPSLDTPKQLNRHRRQRDDQKKQ